MSGGAVQAQLQLLLEPWSPLDARRLLPRVDEHPKNPWATPGRRKSRSRGSPWWGQGPAACLWNNTQTAVTDHPCLHWAKAKSLQGWRHRSVQKPLREQEKLFRLLPLTFAYNNIPPSSPPISLSRGGSFKITVVSRGGMKKGKEKYYRMGMWLFHSSLPRGALSTQGHTRKGRRATGCSESCHELLGEGQE